MNAVRNDLHRLDDAMEGIELRGEVGPVAELLLAGVADRVAHIDLDPASASALTGRMRRLIDPAQHGSLAARDELWAHVRVLREGVSRQRG